MADLCNPCRDPHITANQIRCFLRVKHSLEGSAVRLLLGLHNLGDFIQLLRTLRPRTDTGCYVHATATEGGDHEKPIIVAHSMLSDIQDQLARTDHYFTLYWQSLEERGLAEAVHQQHEHCGEPEDAAQKVMTTEGTSSSGARRSLLPQSTVKPPPPPPKLHRR